MFKKLKDRLAEVGEEVKKDPRFVNSIASVNQLAQQVRTSNHCRQLKCHSEKASKCFTVKVIVKSKPILLMLLIENVSIHVEEYRDQLVE